MAGKNIWQKEEERTWGQKASVVDRISDPDLSLQPPNLSLVFLCVKAREKGRQGRQGQGQGGMAWAAAAKRQKQTTGRQKRHFARMALR